jgi:hypothetical protein
VIALSVVILIWAVASMLAFVYSAQRRFAQLCAEQPADRADVLARNVARAAHEAHTLSLAYLQYLEWAPVLGRFLREPLGTVTPATEEPLPDGSLPRAIGLGRAVPQAGAGLVDEVRDDVLGPGWMAPLWDDVLAEAPGQLAGDERLPGREGRLIQPEDLLCDRMTDGSPLRSWSALVRDQGLPPGYGDAAWRSARGRLFGDRAPALTRELFAQVQTRGRDGGPALSSGDDFLTGLLTALRRPRSFDRELFTAAGRTTASTEVAWTYVVADPASWSKAGLAPDLPGMQLEEAVQDDSGSLGQFVAVVEMSSPLPGPRNLRLSGGDGVATGSETAVHDLEARSAPRTGVQERL